MTHVLTGSSEGDAGFLKLVLSLTTTEIASTQRLRRTPFLAFIVCVTNISQFRVLADRDIQVDVDDLDNLATPEMIMLSAVSGEGAQDR